MTDLTSQISHRLKHLHTTARLNCNLGQLLLPTQVPSPSLCQPMKHLHLVLPPRQLSLLLTSLQISHSLHAPWLAAGTRCALRDRRYISSLAKPVIPHLSGCFGALTLDRGQPTHSVLARSTNSAVLGPHTVVPTKLTKSFTTLPSLSRHRSQAIRGASVNIDNYCHSQSGQQ